MGVVSAVEWMPVESGLFASAAYRASVRQLYVRFHDGKIYRFFDCPSTVYTEFVAAASKGSYFSRQIRNHFRYELVRRGNSGNRHCANPQPCLGERLRASVALCASCWTPNAIAKASSSPPISWRFLRQHGRRGKPKRELRR